jgi:transposase
MYVGVDYHKRYSVTSTMDEQGTILAQQRLSNDPETLTRFVAGLPADTKIALEATGNWYYFYELLENKSPQVYLAHPLKTRVIAEARIKTDKIDATMLAHLLRTNLLPTAYIPPRAIRDIREILRYRASLVSLRTSLKNKVHAMLSKNGIILGCSNIFGKKALRSINGYLGLAETINRLIDEVSDTIKAIVEDNPQAMLLTTIPGISYYSALLIVSEIGDVRRFPTAKKLCCYSGLVPSVHSSGGKTWHGAMTKQGSKWLRWILIELSHHFATSSTRLQRMYARISHKHGKNTARVAVAREMLKIIYYMLRDNRAFIRG